jgi:hypothetical protein
LQQDERRPSTPQCSICVSPTPIILHLIVLICAYDRNKNGWKICTEDLDLWDVALQVCLTHILDNGDDATHVLYHLVGTISCTYIPTGVLVTRAVELMLSHLNIPPNAPTLLRFVNDMLMWHGLDLPPRRQIQCLLCALYR